MLARNYFGDIEPNDRSLGESEDNCEENNQILLRLHRISVSTDYQDAQHESESDLSSGEDGLAAESVYQRAGDDVGEDEHEVVDEGEYLGELLSVDGVLTSLEDDVGVEHHTVDARDLHHKGQANSDHRLPPDQRHVDDFGETLSLVDLGFYVAGQSVRHLLHVFGTVDLFQTEGQVGKVVLLGVVVRGVQFVEEREGEESDEREEGWHQEDDEPEVVLPVLIKDIVSCGRHEQAQNADDDSAIRIRVGTNEFVVQGQSGSKSLVTKVMGSDIKQDKFDEAMTVISPIGWVGSVDKKSLATMAWAKWEVNGISIPILHNLKKLSAKAELVIFKDSKEPPKKKAKTTSS